MKTLVWNCRGLGNRRAENELGELLQAKDPAIVFLSETRLRKTQMTRIKNRMDFVGLFVVPSDDQGGGGLALLWKNNVTVWVDSFSKYHIDAIVNGGSENA